MLFVLGILGSPRRGGNSEILLDKALAGAKHGGAQVEKVVLSQLNILPCDHCDNCLNNGECTINDDMTLLYPKIHSADRFIFSFPIYFCGPPAQAKVFIDRCQSLWVEKVKLKRSFPIRYGLWIAVAGRKKTDFSPARATVKALFYVCGIKLVHELLLPGIEGYQEVLNYPQALEQAFLSGEKLVGSNL